MPKIEIDPEIKKAINKEGFESEEPGSGAAVVIGKKKEMPDLLDKLENEGRATDLESYVRIHKKIAVPNKGVSSQNSSFLKKGIGMFDGIGIRHPKEEKPGNIGIAYVDKDGNIAEVEINPELIEKISLSEEEIRFISSGNLSSSVEESVDTVKKEIKKKISDALAELGFRNIPPEKVGTLWKEINDYGISLKRKKLESKNKNPKEFYF